jgi:hypothetical protein
MDRFIRREKERRFEWTCLQKSGLPLWNSETTGLDERSASNQRLLERLEAENARLRRSVVDSCSRFKHCAMGPEH